MAHTPKFHIILLPRQDYWKWVDVVRDYAVRFHASVTPNPQNALEFHHPEQIVTIVNPANGYPSYGDIAAWFRRQSPDVEVDLLNVNSPDDLRGVVESRLRSGSALARQSAATAESVSVTQNLMLQWPTDYPTIVQGFGANPDLFRRWGLPGHDGVDIKAPVNSRVYACADGAVYAVHDGTGDHPYGIHVRILHRGGYRTVYAHLNRALVTTGQTVRSGDVIGLADGTGSSSGGILHLTLKKDGATGAGLTPYPKNIIDPTPYFVAPRLRKPAEASQPLWSYGHCLVGLHARADGPMEEADWAVVEAARIEAIKLTGHARAMDMQRALGINPSMFVLARLGTEFHSRIVSPRDFVRQVERSAGELYSNGVRHFEVHNEPNLVPEGAGVSWRDGYDFGQWFLQVVGYLKPNMPQARFGWPGLSPGPRVDGLRMDANIFLEEASNLVRQADWLGCHCHWQDDATMLSVEGGLGYKRYHDEWPDKLLFITEFSNTSSTVSPESKGQQYAKYYRLLRDQPGVGGAFAFVVSAASGFNYEVWRSREGKLTPIVTAVSNRLQ